MSTIHCADCSTPYLAEHTACPHCGSTAYTEGDVIVSRRLPLFVTVSCSCGCGPWNLRLSVIQTGLIQLPTLHCASCGRQVQLPWPPAEDEMPKITKHGGPTNARSTDPSPAVEASPPQDVAEDVLGHPTPEPEPAEPEPTQDFTGLTLSELRALAEERGVPSYGTKAQLVDRLRGAETD